MKLRTTFYLLFFYSLLVSAQNDLCANATTLTPTTTYATTAGSFSGSLLDGSPSSCVPNASQDVWYQFVATDPTLYVEVSNATNIGLDIAMEIHAGSCDGTLVTCLNNATATQGYESYFSNNFVAGQTYYIRVLNASANISTRSFNVGVQKFPTPANDLCASATTLTPNTTFVATAGSFSGTFLDGNTSNCAPNASQDVWYKFVATDRTLYVEANNPTNIGLDVAMEIYTESCDGTLVTCLNNTTATQGYEGYFSNNFMVGQTYYIRILNTSANVSTRSFSVGVQKFPTPANDLCTSATTLTPNATFVATAGSFSGTFLDGNTSNCAPNASQDVWYKFVATDRTLYVEVNNPINIGLDVAMEIYTESCDGTLVTCLNNATATQGYEGYFNNNFVVGQTYYIRVLNTSANVSTQNFSVGIQKFPTPANDLCASATTIYPRTTCVATPGSFSGTFFNGNPSSCAPNASQDAWYTFVATNATLSVWVTNPINTGLDVAMEIYSGSCNGTLMGCQNNTTASQGYEGYTGNNFVAGQTYFIRVLNTSANISTHSFSVCVQDEALNTDAPAVNPISISPNPVKDVLKIANLDDFNNYSYQIINLQGQIIAKGKLQQDVIYTDSLSKGFYILKLSNPTKEFAAKFIKD